MRTKQRAIDAEFMPSAARRGVMRPRHPLHASPITAAGQTDRCRPAGGRSAHITTTMKRRAAENEAARRSTVEYREGNRIASN